MKIAYKLGADAVDWEALTKLYRDIGLVGGLGKKGSHEEIRRAFRNSYRVVTAWVDHKLVGAGRMLSDGVCYGMIFDVGVLPSFQGKGIGKGMMAELMKDTEHIHVHLTSTFGNESFYSRLGFRRHKNAFAKYPQGYGSDYLADE